MLSSATVPASLNNGFLGLYQEYSNRIGRVRDFFLVLPVSFRNIFEDSLTDSLLEDIHISVVNITFSAKEIHNAVEDVVLTNLCKILDFS